MGNTPETDRAAESREAVIPRRLPSSRFRALRAYWVTLKVVLSYLTLRFWARFRSTRAMDRLLVKKHKKNADRILRAIVCLQGLYIKVGQLISILSNVLPEEFRAGLTTLQDQAPPRRAEVIEKRIREEFGVGTDELFAEFEPEAIAAASIGQVHKARLKDGDLVAVKIQYPDIDKVVHTDLRALKRIVQVVALFLPDHGVPDVYNEIRKIILKELDFEDEARNIERIAENFEGRPDVKFPRVVMSLSTSRVLTTTFVEGIKVSHVDELDQAGIDRKALARLIIHTYCQQIFTDRIYHADPHPGNLMVQPGPSLVFLDFGAVAEVSPGMREGMIEFVQGGLAGDTEKIIRGMKAMGFVSKRADPEIFDRIVAYFHDRFKEEIRLESLNLKDIKIDPEKGLERLADLRQMDISLRDITDSFYVPKEWIMLERTILLLMGLCTELDPDLNPMSVIRPYLERFVFADDMDWSDFLINTAQSAATNLITLPADIRMFMKEVRSGGMRMSFPDVGLQVRVIYSLGQQIIWAALAIAGAAFALELHDRGYATASRWCVWGTVTAGVFFLLNLLSGRSRIRRAKHKDRR